LKERKPGVQVIAVEPAASPCSRAGPRVLTRSRASVPASCPTSFNTHIYDEIIEVANQDAFDTAHRAAHEEGLLVGISSGAALWPRCRWRTDPRTPASRLW